VVLGLLVDALQVSNYEAVDGFPQLLVLAFEQLQENRQHLGGRHNVFASHHLEASHEA